MSILSKLTIVAETTVGTDPMQNARNALITNLQRQVKVLEGIKTNKPFTLPATNWEVDEEGNKTKIEYDKPVKPWFEKVANGYALTIRFRNAKLQLSKTGNTIIVKDDKQLAEVLEGLQHDVADGAFDKLLQEQLDKRSK